ncbi:tRNA (adenosine(37)-N6)-threonylcarbamoyltransferase complex dimerization subunit type 1 TsaB [Methylobacterium soli]|uniref:tRNA (Adenosine(37)-N6)-threonylcarbamoyltransferase complex dimerization subunit type 1 TsaB n=1 Tax=Methylobacterium soli TaxID=553447 RepID=A0A6L3T4B0_9HYPH|nr:tRNA (adenosine(37)-N6)-threonylcarbamoyltransferase complex dimerization subunit type 1 TsaB [Methylobacterium soli]KAB1081619.1 tRNA (adenosine(37)-N6)-threonylcarbamoyltransferase complex dimerization subunit type 1 TsaB [Methylobacterium soli]GJE41097.1 tRNA threonylcarbamoyladenosine biosynthesis protein TsaB [Methylobacterium soli]
MRILAIDTALDACAACVATDASDDLLAQESMVLARGHAEALLPLVERVISRIEGGFESLDRVAVTVGPGSYTGLRVGLSAARAIGLATGVPVVGVTTLSALLAPLLALNGDGLIAAAIDARHGAVYLQAMSVGEGIVVPPSLLKLDEAVERLGAGPLTLIGSGAPALAAAAKSRGVEAEVAGTGAPEIAWVASLGIVADPAQAMARPLYLRGPDAQPQDHARLARQ